MLLCRYIIYIDPMGFLGILENNPGSSSRIITFLNFKCCIEVFLLINTVDWKKSGDHRLRLVAYPIIYKLFFSNPRWLAVSQISEPSTVSFCRTQAGG